MNLLEYSSRERLPSELKDPFGKSKMTVFRTYCSCRYDGVWSYRGGVEFNNGNTKGEQEFRADSFSELLTKMAAFIQTLPK